MNKKVIASMGLPMVIRNKAGSLATIELNLDDFVVCRFHPNNPIYLHDSKLQQWYPANWIKRMIYRFKLRLIHR